MNRIILAYAPENADLAASIDQQLSRIGIPFEHASGAIAEQIASSGEPVLLLVTDNLLINRACMGGLPPALQGLAAKKRLVAVIADGINAAGQPVPTHIDRMANALHYMKHWQDAWLALSDQHQQAEEPDKDSLVAELDATRAIANEVGDLISTLRDAGYLTWSQFEANDFEQFFQKFELQDWHGQYKRLTAQAVENQVLNEPIHLPEISVSGGLLAPEPVDDLVLPIATDEPLQAEPKLEAVDVLLKETTTEPAPPRVEFPETENKEMDGGEAQAVRDAWFWIDKGHLQRGLELFQMALEQYPESQWLIGEYERAAQLASPPIADPKPAETQTLETATPSPTDEAKSYVLMGDMAAERGDYLFAKYCWDRVVEIDPKIPNIYRKLGLMTAEHLRDYRETATIYLQKALEANPNDTEVKTALAELAESSGISTVSFPTTELEDTSTKEVASTNPEVLAGVENVASSEAIPNPETGEQRKVFEGQQETQGSVGSKSPNPQIPKSPTHQINKSPLVLITGATSGIGKATAEIFAQNGYRLILTGRRVERLVELKNQFEAEFGTEVLLLPFDVRDPGAVEAALGNLPDAFQEIDILVNNAGLAKGLAPIHEGNLEHWETMIDTNVKGLLYVSRLVSPGMVRRRRGHIINVGSSASKEAYPNGNVYCATKFAVEALTRSMRFDLHAHNIRVSQVSPGHVEETEFAITRFDGDAERAKIYNDFQPLKSSDVADAIYYMATRPPHVNIQDIQLFATQQASSMVVDRSGR